jgi:GNAT superfamily N-acetyltransferase
MRALNFSFAFSSNASCDGLNTRDNVTLSSMKLVNWVRFTWDLTKLSSIEAALPEHYEIVSATAEDEKELRKVITTSFVLDPAWSAAMHDLKQTIDAWLLHAFEPDRTVCLTLRHGLRIIGAAVLSLDRNAENHLAPGPCVLVEYRNRGFGTHLLAHSLQTLRDAGLSRAIAIAEENTPVAKFLYTKFNGQAAPADFPPLLAA